MSKEKVIVEYYNVKFFIELEEWKVEYLKMAVEGQVLNTMHKVHEWCTRQGADVQSKFYYKRHYPITANVWNLASYLAFKYLYV